MHFDDLKPLLEAIAMADAQDKPLDVDELAATLGIELDDIDLRMEWAEQRGLIGISEEPTEPHWLRDAGRQYLTRRGMVSDESMRFLPSAIDDLHARDALRLSSSLLIEDFAAALIDGRAREHAAALVPSAFAVAVDDRRGVTLFAAASALIARLSREDPAACVAEEVMGLALLKAATALLDERSDRGEVDQAERDAAVASLHGLFDVFEDDDVRALLEMTDPADVAIEDQSVTRQDLRVVDQRVEAWFRPLFGYVAAGHLTPSEDV